MIMVDSSKMYFRDVLLLRDELFIGLVEAGICLIIFTFCVTTVAQYVKIT